MTKCTSCGQDHAMVLEDSRTGEQTPIDWCKDCFFTKGYVYKEPDQVVFNEADTPANWQNRFQEAQDRIIRDMLLSSAVPSQILEDPTSKIDR